MSVPRGNPTSLLNRILTLLSVVVATGLEPALSPTQALGRAERARPGPMPAGPVPRGSGAGFSHASLGSGVRAQGFQLGCRSSAPPPPVGTWVFVGAVSRWPGEDRGYTLQLYWPLQGVRLSNSWLGTDTLCYVPAVVRQYREWPPPPPTWPPGAEGL